MKLTFHGFEQVGDFFPVNVELAIPSDAEMPVAQDFCARKQIAEKVTDQRPKKNVIQ